MSNAVENAKRLIAEKEAKIKELEAEMAEAKQFIALAGKFEHATPGTRPIVLVTSAEMMNLAHGPLARRLSKKDEILNAVSGYLTERRAMHTEAILERLNTDSIEVGGANPLANLSAYLSRAKDRFEHRRALGGWMLKKSPSDVSASLGLDDEAALI